MSCTHVIAGTCAARTLAEYGAEVLHIARDQSFEHEILVNEVNVGMRSSFVDLKNPAQKRVFAKLLPEADVFLEGFRGRAMENLGFGVKEVATRRPGVIYLSVRCYSWDGPWWNRPGFDMEALTVSGYTVAEAGGVGHRPSFPPTMVLNDFIAGYLGAAGIIAALRRRAREGGSYRVMNCFRANRTDKPPSYYEKSMRLRPNAVQVELSAPLRKSLSAETFLRVTVPHHAETAESAFCAIPSRLQFHVLKILPVDE